MDPALARMLARKKQQQEAAEDEEWKPSPVKTPAKPSIPQESSKVVMDENDPIASVIGDALSLQEGDDNLNGQAAAPAAHAGPALVKHAPAVADFSVPGAPPSAHAAASDPLTDFFGASIGAQHEAGTAPEASASCAPAAAVSVSSARAADTIGALASAPMAGNREEIQRADVPDFVAGPRDGEASVKRAASSRKKKGEETFTKISSSGGSVPVLVIPTSGAGDWRQGAQDVSSAYNGLVKSNGAPAASKAGQRPANEGHDKTLLNTMAKKNAKILSALSPRNLGAGSIWDSALDEPAPGDTDTRGRSRPARGAHANARSTSPKTKKKHGNRSTSVPANARAHLLDNNVLALSTGSIDERSEAARRICGRANTIPELRKLVDAGVVRSVASLLAEPKGMHAAVDALLPLCAHVGPSGEQSTQELLKEFCFEVEAHGIAEKLSALLCWSSTADVVKGKIATVMFYLAKEDHLANRIVKQDGALRSLVQVNFERMGREWQLLDSENDSINSSAAAALANITYWSSEPVPRYSHLRILAAV